MKKSKTRVVGSDVKLSETQKEDLREMVDEVVKSKINYYRKHSVWMVEKLVRREE